MLAVALTRLMYHHMTAGSDVSSAAFIQVNRTYPRRL